MNELKITTEMKGNVLQVGLQGPMDEDANYDVINLDGVTVAVFDFEKISLINSVGIQRWIAYFKMIPESIACRFEKCATNIVNQINQFPMFVAGKKVTFLSFMAPYFCEDCDKDFAILVTPEECGPREAPKAPAKKCPSCGADNIEFDSIEKKYFLFLTRSN